MANRAEVGNPAAGAADADPATRWACENTSAEPLCSLTLNLSAPSEVTSVEFDFYKGDERFYTFDFAVSNDPACQTNPNAAEWRLLDENMNSSGTGYGTTVRFYNQGALSCLRYTGKGNSSNDWNSIVNTTLYFPGVTEEVLYQVYGTLEADFVALAQTLAKLQREQDGLWNATLVGGDDPESSASALIAYGLAKGINLGVLSRQQFMPVVLKAWQGLQYKSLQESGTVLAYVQSEAQQPSAVAPRLVNRVDATQPDNQFALGALLTLAEQVEQLQYVGLRDVVGYSEDANPPVNAIDGDFNTRWSTLVTYEDTNWIAMRFPEPVSGIDAMDLAFYRGDVRQAYFGLSYNDADTCLGSGYDLGSYPIPGASERVSTGATLDYERYSFAPLTAQCLFVKGFGNTENDWFSLTELRVHASLLPPATGERRDLADAQFMANREQVPNVAANVNDGTSSRWSCETLSSADPCTLTVALGEPVNLSAVSLTFYNAERLNHYRLASTLSDDCDSEAATWHTLASGFNLAPSGTDVIQTSVQASCLRFSGFGNSVNNWTSLTGLAVYE